MKTLKKLLAVVLVLSMSLSLVACSTKSQPKDEIEAAIQQAGKYLVSKNTKPTFGDEWMMVGLLRSDYIDYWHNRAIVYESSMNSFLNKNTGVVGKKGEVYAADYPAVIYAFTACGKFADRTSSADLIMGISFDNIVMQGGYINKINALTALQSAKYNVYAEGDITQQQLIDFVLSLKQQDGSFAYKGMTETPIYVTACAVNALALCPQTEEITTAIQEGADYLASQIRKTDSLEDVVFTVIALNSTGRNTTDLQGKNLINWILEYQKADGAFSTVSEDKKGNKNDTSLALLALASEYRLNNGKTSLFDMTDIAGGTHNKLSPGWSAYLSMMKVFGGAMLVFMTGLLIVSRIRIKKWREAGIYNEAAGRMMTDDEIAQSKKAKEIKENNNDNS